MKFIVLLFTVLLQKQTKQQGYKRKRTWFTRLASLFNAQTMSPRTQVVAYGFLVLLPSLLLGGIISSLSGLLGNLLALVLQVLLLLYILGRDDFSQRFDIYRSCWRKQDYQGAFECARSFLGVKNADHVENPEQLHRSVSKAMVYAWFLRFFVFIFWYLALGIGGSLMCLLSYWFYREFKYDWSKNVIGAIEWLPSRLLALTTALAGDFTRTFPVAIRSLFDFQTPSNDVLANTVFSEGLNESDFECESAEQSLEDTNQMLFRCAVIWLLFVALLTVFAGF